VLFVPSVLGLGTEIFTLYRRLLSELYDFIATLLTLDECFCLWSQYWSLELLTRTSSPIERFLDFSFGSSSIRWCAQLLFDNFILDFWKFIYCRCQVDLDLLSTSILHACVIAVIYCYINVLWHFHFTCLKLFLLL
jgi:hypothetical protein